MGLLDYTVLFNAIVWSLFFIPHAFMEDGNMGAMGFTPAAFMPRKYPLPPEIDLLINHMVGIFGCAGIGMIATLLCAAALADTALGDVETVPTLWHLARYESCVEVSELLYTRNCWHESSTELAELLESNYADDEKRQVG